MKRINNLYPILISDENLRSAILEVNKTHRWNYGHKANETVKEIDNNLDEYIVKLRNIIVNGFTPSPVKTTTRWDKNAKKFRDISEPKLWPDQYIHHAVIQVISPTILKRADYYCCGSIPRKGTHFGVRKIKKWMKEDKSNTKYCMELDIHHFYNNISQEVVINKLKTLVKDFKFLEVCERMISCGILIGAYYSQWFANMILEDLDKKIRLCDGVVYYCRYMDNITIFGPNKKKLHKARAIIEQELSKLRLQLKSNWQVFPTKSRKPNALGYVYGHGYTMLRKATKLKLIRAINKYKRKKKNKKKITYKMACSIMSRLRAMQHCNHKRFFEKYLPKGMVKELKLIISNRQRRVLSKKGKKKTKQKGGILPMNMIILTGRLTKDPELKESQKGGSNYCYFTLAVERPVYRDQEKVTDFFECQISGKNAETLCKYCYKGRPITVTGVMISNKKKDANGNSVTYWDVKVNDFEFCLSDPRREEASKEDKKQEENK